MTDPQLFPAPPNTQEHVKRGKNEGYTQIGGEVTELATRIRLLEEKYGTLRKKTQLTDQNIIETEKTTNKAIKTFTQEIKELKLTVQKMKEESLELKAAINKTAKEHELKELKTYAGFLQKTVGKNI